MFGARMQSLLVAGLAIASTAKHLLRIESAPKNDLQAVSSNANTSKTKSGGKSTSNSDLHEIKSINNTDDGDVSFDRKLVHATRMGKGTTGAADMQMRPVFDFGGNHRCSSAKTSLLDNSTDEIMQRSYFQAFPTRTIVKKHNIPAGVLAKGIDLEISDARHRVQVNRTGIHRSPLVVLQLTHLMKEADRCRLSKIRQARSQLPAGYDLICFWWTDENSAYQNWSVTSLTALRHACGQKLITFHIDVLPHYREIISALQLTLSSSIERRRPKWQWWYSDVPFILSYHRFRETFFSQSDLVWYMEDDLHWTGNLGDMLSQLQPDSWSYGYGVETVKHANTNCSLIPRWHICRHIATFIDKCTRFSHGQIQMVWYSPRLLEKLFQHLQSKEFAYCEAFAASVCNEMTDCQIDEFGKRAPDVFKHYTYECCFQVELTTANQIVHPAKACDSHLYANVALELDQS